MSKHTLTIGALNKLKWDGVHKLLAELTGWEPGDIDIKIVSTFYEPRANEDYLTFEVIVK